MNDTCMFAARIIIPILPISIRETGVRPIFRHCLTYDTSNQTNLAFNGGAILNLGELSLNKECSLPAAGVAAKALDLKNTSTNPEP